MNILYFICAMCNIRKESGIERVRKTEERQKRASNLNERNVGRTGKKPQTISSIFCVLSQQQRTFIQQASKSLLIVFHPTEIYLYFARSHFIFPSAEEEKFTRPRVRPTNFHGLYTESFRSHFLLMYFYVNRDETA